MNIAFRKRSIHPLIVCAIFMLVLLHSSRAQDSTVEVEVYNLFGSSFGNNGVSGGNGSGGVIDPGSGTPPAQPPSAPETFQAAFEVGASGKQIKQDCAVCHWLEVHVDGRKLDYGEIITLRKDKPHEVTVTDNPETRGAPPADATPPDIDNQTFTVYPMAVGNQTITEIPGAAGEPPKGFIVNKGEVIDYLIDNSQQLFAQNKEWPQNAAEEPMNKKAKLVPVQIEARKQGTTAAPETGLLVKKGDVLEFALAPQFFDTADNFEELITWQQRQLKGDGTYTEWLNISAQATGTKFEHPTAESGIFQVKAIISNGGEHEYKRKKDAPHGANKDGVFNENLRKGKADYIGVVDAQWQIHIRNQAFAKLGQATWAQSATLTAAQIGFGVDVDFIAAAGSDKCNIFVFMQANAAGATVPTRTWRDYLIDIPPWIDRNIAPTADEWDDSGATATTWTWLPTTTFPQPGYVVSRTSIIGTTHIGIIDYDGTWINAGLVAINKYIDFTMSFYQPVHFRKK